MSTLKETEAAVETVIAAVPTGARRFFLHLLTGIDGVTFDISRVLLFAMGIAFIGQGIWHVYANKTFDPQAFGIGAGALLGGGGAGIAVKAKTEPDA